MKRVVVIGSGNVAEALVRALAASPYDLVQVAARNVARGQALAQIGGCTCTDKVASPAKADIYLIAVSDSAIADIAATADFGGGVVAHTAGGVDLDALGTRIEHRAVLYPLQTFTAGRAIDFSRIPILVEASTPIALEAITALAQTLSGSVRYASSELRAQVHLAAVFACNFTNFMYTVAENILKQSDLEFELLKPLIEECAAKAVASASPATAQTGPAVRGDTATQQRHLELLHDEQLKAMYRIISENIWKTLRKQ